MHEGGMKQGLWPDLVPIWLVAGWPSDPHSSDHTGISLVYNPQSCIRSSPPPSRYRQQHDPGQGAEDQTPYHDGPEVMLAHFTNPLIRPRPARASLAESRSFCVSPSLSNA